MLKLRIPERYAAKVTVGQLYRARLNTHKGLIRNYFYGEVQFLRDVIQGEDTNTWRTAYCSFDPKGNDIAPGTTAEAKITYGESPFWFFLVGIDL